MNQNSIFEFFERLIRIDDIDISQIQDDFRKDPDYDSGKNHLSRRELYDGSTDTTTYLEKPWIITFEDHLKEEFQTSINDIYNMIEIEEVRIESKIDNIVFLVSCLSKVDTFLARAKHFDSKFSDIIIESLSTLSSQLHLRYDKEVEIKTNFLFKESGSSQSKFMSEVLQKMHANSIIKDSDNSSQSILEMNSTKANGKLLRFSLNRNETTILFMLLKDGGVLKKETIDADLAKFLEKNCSFCESRSRINKPLTNITSLISDFRTFEKRNIRPKQKVKELIRDSQIVLNKK